MKFTREKGAVLVVSLMLLVVMTLLAISAINMSSINLRIVSNVQQQMEAETATQEAIEQVISYFDNFDNPDAYPTIPVSGVKTTLESNTTTINGRNVSINNRVCFGETIAPKDSLKIASEQTVGIFYDTNWEVVASHTDSDSGAQTTIHQGVQIRLPYKCP